MKGSILFVDDDSAVISALQRSFCTEEYQCYFAGGGKKALDILAGSQIDIIISDISMPVMDGYALLARVKEQYPEIIRIIISGYTDEQHTLKAIMDGTAKLFIAKPWSNEKLKEQIESLLCVKYELKQENLLHLVNQVENLPSMPSLYYQISAQLTQGIDIPRIAKLIQKEPAYTVKILKVANSSFFNLNTASIEKAMVYLGINNVKNIILAARLFDLANPAKSDIYKIETLWMHSLICNGILVQLHKQIYKKNIPEEAAIAGLLHDMGKLVIKQYFPKRLQEIEVYLKKHEETGLSGAERAVLGFSHATMGAFLFNWWNLPSILVESCMYHHNPLDENVFNKKILVLLYLANVFAHHIMQKTVPRNIDKVILSFLELNENQAGALFAKLSIPGYH